MLLYKKANVLFLRVNTFYSTTTRTTEYIPNPNASLAGHQEEIKQSEDRDPEVCHDMLNATAILCVCVRMCVCVYVHMGVK